MITYKGVDIGNAVLSTLISNLREPNPDLNRYREVINKSLKTSEALTDFLDDFLDRENYDLVYLFNGRFNLFRPLMRLCQQKDLKFFVQERAPGSNNRYSLTVNTFPHDLETYKSQIMSFWESSPLPLEKKNELAQSWFNERSRGVSNSWYTFTDQQKASTLPSDFDPKKKNISIFISSEDEFETIDKWANPFFQNQTEGIRFILGQFEDLKDYHFYLRIHPNLRGLKNSQTRSLEELKYSNLTKIEASESIDTYSLIKNSFKVISFGSTVGIEATALGIPSILIGRAFYEDLKSVIIPKNRHEIINSIQSQAPAPELQDYYIYGFWMKCSGEDFKYYSPKNLSEGVFNSYPIRGNLALRTITLLITFLNNLFQVLRGQMSWIMLKNKCKNKLNLK